MGCRYGDEQGKGVGSLPFYLGSAKSMNETNPYNISR